MSSTPRSGAFFPGALLTAALLALGAPLFPQALEVPEGFQSREVLRLDPARFTGGLAYAPDGALLAYDGQSVIRRGPAGEVEILFTPRNTLDAGPIFGSFLAVTPDGQAVLFGENTLGNLHRIPLDHFPITEGEVRRADNVPFNYDFDFDGQGRGFISAFGTSGGNSIVLLDDDPAVENDIIVGSLPGFSGPLAIDGEGNLYYGTAIFDGSPNRLLRFSAAQVESAIGGGILGPDDATELLDGISNKFAMSAIGGTLYLSDAGAGTIDVLAGDRLEPFARIAPPPGVFPSVTYFAFLPGPRNFSAGAGRLGGRLLANITDFATFNDLWEAVPELHFVRGETNGDGAVDISDARALLDYLFLGEAAPDPLEAGDLNDDGEVDISDPIYLLFHLFLGGPPPPAPYPDPGADPTP